MSRPPGKISTSVVGAVLVMPLLRPSQSRLAGELAAETAAIRDGLTELIRQVTDKPEP